MRVLLGLSGVKLLQAIGSDDVGKNVLGERLGEGDLDVEGGVVLGHGDKVGQRGNDLAVEAVEALLRERAGHLAGAVRAEVEEDDGIAISDALVVANERIDELVTARVLLVERLDALNRIGLDIGRLGDGVVGELDALPAVVAVHGPIATLDRGDAGVAAGLGGNLG